MRRMKRVGFMARWEITDLDRSVPDLIPEALEELPDLASEAGAILIGPPVWTRHPVMIGGVPHLECRVPAWRARRTLPHIVEAVTAANAGGSLVEFTPCMECDLPAGRNGLCESHRRAAYGRAPAVAS